MKYLKKILLLWAIVAFLTGCRDQASDQIQLVLRQVASCMEEHPDSALQQLQSISGPEKLRGKARADYALLYSQACEKNRIIITNDSLIRIATDYYQHKRKCTEAARSFFYLGCVYRNAGEDACAIEAYLRALEKLPERERGKLRMQIYFFLGERYNNQDLFEDGLRMYLKCLEAAQILNDSTLLLFPYLGIAQSHLFNLNSDSAIIYFNKALRISRILDNAVWEANVLNGLSHAFLLKGDSVQSKKYVYRSLEISRNDASLYLAGEFLYKENLLDSARLFLSECCLSENFNTKVISYGLLYEIERKNRNNELAFAYCDSFRLYNDSLYNQKKFQKVQNVSVGY